VDEDSTTTQQGAILRRCSWSGARSTGWWVGGDGLKRGGVGRAEGLPPAPDAYETLLFYHTHRPPGKLTCPACLPGLPRTQGELWLSGLDSIVGRKERRFL
jgi:hypothetical protein